MMRRNLSQPGMAKGRERRESNEGINYLPNSPARGVSPERRKHPSPSRSPRRLNVSQPPSRYPSRAGLARHKRHPRAFHGCGRAGAIGPSRHAHGPRAGRLSAVDPFPAAQSAKPRVARPRSIRAVLRPRVDAAVLGALSQRIRSLAGRPEELPPMGIEDAGTSRARPHSRGGNHHRTLGAGLWKRGRNGHGRTIPGRPVQPTQPCDNRSPGLGLCQRWRSNGRGRQ